MIFTQNVACIMLKDKTGFPNIFKNQHFLVYLSFAFLVSVPILCFLITVMTLVHLICLAHHVIYLGCFI